MGLAQSGAATLGRSEPPLHHYGGILQRCFVQYGLVMYGSKYSDCSCNDIIEAVRFSFLYLKCRKLNYAVLTSCLPLTIFCLSNPYIGTAKWVTAEKSRLWIPLKYVHVLAQLTHWSYLLTVGLNARK